MRGNDLEDDYEQFADTYWHYTEKNEANDTSYYEWLQYQFRQIGENADVDPTDYGTINDQLASTVENSNSPIFGYSVHDLPSTKTQQYYEMIGKYPQFVYGWEDVAEDELNPTVVNDDGTINYGVRIEDVNSNLRMQYENKRDDSNKKLEAGQRGIYIMIISRVVSAIHAGRLAYKHNQSLNSELSSIDFDVVEKRFFDEKVPMFIVSKKF